MLSKWQPKKKYLIFYTIAIVLGLTPAAMAMHISEGFLPIGWAAFWWLAIIPFFVWGIRVISRTLKDHPRLKLLLALSGAFAFVLSALKMPSVTGSCSHPTGTGLCAVLFGPSATVVIGFIVLLFQALLLAHGGLTTLGANTFSMAVVGPFVAYGVFILAKKLNAPSWLSVFLAAALGDLLTYVTTAVQLSLAFPSATGGFLASLIKFSAIFAVTQVPLAISEGILTVIIFNMLAVYAKEELSMLSFFNRKEVISA